MGGHASRTNAPFDYDYIIIKYNSLGVQQWANRFGALGAHDIFKTMVVSTNGEVFATGTGGTVKYHSTGLLAWNLPYAGLDIVADDQGFAYITGFSTNDFATAKIDSLGSNVWVRTWDAAGKTDVSKRIAIDTFGNVFVAGMVAWYCDRAGCYYDPYILKYNSQGTAVWTNVFEHGTFSILTEIRGFACDLQGSLYIAIPAWGAGVCCNWDTAKISPAGVRIWFRALKQAIGPFGVTALTLDANANVYYTGYSESYKLTSTGTNIWNVPYSGRGNAIAADGAGNAYVAAQSAGPGNSATIKYGPNGQKLWEKRFTPAGYPEDQPHAIAVAANGDVYVTGFSNPSPGTYEITTIKYIQVTPIQKKVTATSF